MLDVSVGPTKGSSHFFCVRAFDPVCAKEPTEKSNSSAGALLRDIELQFDGESDVVHARR